MARALASARGTTAMALAAGVVLLAVYGCLSLFMDDAAYLGSDTGPKVAVVDEMSEQRTWTPEVDYWAERFDPEGRFHPSYQSVLNDRGRWVPTTTVVMLLVARPLYDIGGLRLALLLPMLGGVAAAYGARALATRLSGRRRGWLAFWVTGLASPATFYALDFWEHTLGLALMIWGFVHLHDAMERGRPIRSAAVAGVLFGASAAMRTETYLFAGVGFAVTCLHLWRRASFVLAAKTGAAASACALVVIAANAQLEESVHALSRAARATGAAERSFGSFDRRFNEAAQTFLALDAGPRWPAVTLGACSVIATILGTRLLRRGEKRLGSVCLVVPFLLLLVAFGDGFGFVPGLLLAAPPAVLGFLALDGRPGRRALGLIALLSLVAVWSTQFLGGAAPQWGGRYILTAGLLLSVLGLTASTEAVPKLALGAVVALAFIVTVQGLAWQAERRSDFADYFDRLLAIDSDVYIATNAFLPREVGPRMFEVRFLASAEGLDEPVAIARESGACLITVFGWLGRAPEAEDLSGPAVEVAYHPIGVDDLGLTGAKTFNIC